MLINGISYNCRVPTFCKNAGIPLSNFYRWRKESIEAEPISFQRNHAPNRSIQELLFKKEMLCNQLELQIELQKSVNKNTSKLNTSKKLELITIIETSTLPKSKSLKEIGISRSTYYKWLKRFREYGKDGLALQYHLSNPTNHKYNNPSLINAVFSILHSPPSEYGINRTTWTMNLIKNILAKKGHEVGLYTITRIIKNAGYRLKKAREVLTSNDPEYREKLNAITKILSTLGPKDRFFSIDEFGPFAVKQRGGRRLVRYNEYPTIPQWQFSKGFIIVTGALELSTNQITHFYSAKKDSEEMIKLLRILIKKYSGCRRIFISWDSASWHSSKVFMKEVETVNRYSYRKKHNTPIVKLAPLPARAQFLNVIESIYSGMAKAIIHNSDYPSVEEAKTAIDRYFYERNKHFKKNPKRAGKKIWGDELVPPQFRETQNCKNPNWR
jgi:transposase